MTDAELIAEGRETEYKLRWQPYARPWEADSVRRITDALARRQWQPIETLEAAGLGRDDNIHAGTYLGGYFFFERVTAAFAMGGRYTVWMPIPTPPAPETKP